MRFRNTENALLYKSQSDAYMKLLLLLSFLLLFFGAGAQNLSWFHGDWTGETYFPNGPITKRIIVKLHIVKLTGNHFEATLENFYPNDTTVRLERALTGHIVNKKLVIESSRQTYILDPRTQNFWHDCSGCEIQSDFSINSDKIEMNIQTVNCGDECNGITAFSRDTSDLDKTQQNDLAKWFHLPTAKSITKTDNPKAKDSVTSSSKTSLAKPKTDTLAVKKITAKDIISEVQKKESTNENKTSNKPSLIGLPSLKKADSLALSKPQKQPSLPTQKKATRDSVATRTVELALIKKDSLTKSIIPKADSTPVALTTRTTNLVTTYHVSSPHIVIQLFDNAEIDGDVVTVYHNGQLITNRQSLTHKAITIVVEASKLNAHHEFVMVADNLGLIPPNTALMRITAGEQKFEVEISSDFDNNAKIAIDYTGD